MGTSLADYSRIQLLSFLCKVLHVRHPCYMLKSKELNEFQSYYRSFVEFPNSKSSGQY
jgi:hypothetical protein